MLAQGKLLRNVLVMNMGMQLEDISASIYEKEISQLSKEQVYAVVVRMVKGLLETFIRNAGEKKFYYISTAFEKGSFLENNLRNLGIYETLEGVLTEKGQSISDLKVVEEEYIGEANSFEHTSKNFFEAVKKRGLTSEAMGIRAIGNPEELNGRSVSYDVEKSWLDKLDVNYEVIFGEVTAKILLYNMNVVAKKQEIFRLHLYDLEIEDEILEQNKQIYHDYFLVNASVKQILQDMRNNKYDLRKMDEHAEIGFEGKYVAFVIPELIRIMVDEKAIPVEEAMEIVRKICGYSDFTMMAEAVNTCPSEYVEKLVPHLIEKMKNMEMKREDD